MNMKIITTITLISGILFSNCSTTSPDQEEHEKRKQNSPQYRKTHHPTE